MATNISRLAGGFGNFLLSLLLLITGPAAVGTSEWRGAGSAETVHVGGVGSRFHATASVERTGHGRVWTLRLEVHDPGRHSAHESE